MFAIAVVCALSAAGATMSDFVAKSIGTDDGMLPYREALVNAGGLESTSNVQRFLAQYRPVIHQ